MSTNNEQKHPKVRGKFQARHKPEKMIYEVARRSTFKTWSKTCPIKPNPLAKAGFFYVGIFDRVKCFSCGGQIEGWEKKDTAMGLHIEKFPHCDMAKNQDKKNIPIEECNDLKKCKKLGTEEVDGQVVLDINKTLHSITTDDNVDAFWGTAFTEMLSSAKYPLLGGELDRLDTFGDKWSDEFKLPSSETRWLANAGFYYAGPGDRARCFYCNCGIENWEGDDEPWSEHARNFPTCEYLLEMKGKDFVNEVQVFFKNAKASEEAEKREPKQSPAASTQSSPPDHQKTPASEAGESEKDKKVSATQLIEIMYSPTVKMIMKSGFDAALVCSVLETQLRETDLNFSSSDNFIKTLEEAAIRKNSTDGKSVESSASTIDTQTQKFANLEINNDSRQEESKTTQSGQKSFVTARSSEYKQFSSTTSSTRYLQDVRPKKVMCKVCKRQDVATILHPCNHEVACLQCARVATTCPQCATHITNYRRISIML